MAIVVVKRGKYMTGHSSCTGFRTAFSWTHDLGQARRFSDDEPYAENLANESGGKQMTVPNTKRELRDLGRARVRYLAYIKANPTHTVWTPPFFRNKETA